MLFFAPKKKPSNALLFPMKSKKYLNDALMGKFTMDTNYLKPETEDSKEEPTVDKQILQSMHDKCTEDKLDYCDGNQKKQLHTNVMHISNAL